jgi:hypothetical protein
MSVRKRIGNVCLICGGLIVAGGHVEHECHSKLCPAPVVVLPDAPHPDKTPGPFVKFIQAVASSTSSSLGSLNIPWIIKM